MRCGHTVQRTLALVVGSTGPTSSCTDPESFVGARQVVAGWLERVPPLRASLVVGAPTRTAVPG
jgi:hypothetical protein